MLGPLEIVHRLSLPLGHADSISIVPKPLSITENEQKSASVDLRLGRWFLGLQQSRTNVIDLSQSHEAGDFEASNAKANYVPFGKKFVIHPGRFVLATTLEWVSLSNSMGGYITGRSTIGRRGLVIETAAGLHPGFSGCITLELANCGEVPIAIVPGMRICQVFFHKLDGFSEGNTTNFGGRRKPTFGPYNLDPLVKKIANRQNSLFD